jgi:hypothetical protein
LNSLRPVLSSVRIANVMISDALFVRR